ncbi:MAG: hypothetical protein SNH63_02395 [Rikenellaceae bacterium]
MTRIAKLGLCAVTCMLCAAGCAKRKSLSDKELAQVFHDAFLTNAYVSSEGFNLDSLRLYEPIFQKYGYTTADVQYTIGSFSTRKSARLGDVVERAIAMLESEGLSLDRQVAVLDTIDNIAKRRSSVTLIDEPLIEMREWSDTTKIQFVLTDLTPGQYAINFDYRIDSLSNVEGYSFKTWLESLNNDYEYNRTNNSSAQLSTAAAAQMVRSINVQARHKRMIIELAMPQRFEIEEEESESKKASNQKKTTAKKQSERRKDGEERPSITIKNFTVRQVPSVETARTINFERMVPIRVFNDTFYYETPQDSI